MSNLSLSSLLTFNPTKAKLGHQTFKKSVGSNNVIRLAGAGQKQVDHPESVSHEIQGKVSVHTEI